MKHACIAFLLALCLLALPACRGGSPDHGKTSGPVITGSENSQSARTEVLTGVYRPVELALPEGYQAGYETKECTPAIDPETGAVTTVLTRIDGESPRYLLATTDAEHGVTRTVPLPVPEGEQLTRWAFDADGRLFFASMKIRTGSETGFRSAWDITLYRFDAPGEGEEGTLSEGVDLNAAFGCYDTDFYLSNFIADAEGAVWVEAAGQRLIYSPELFLLDCQDDRNNSPMTAIPGGGAAVQLNSLVIGVKRIDRDGTAHRIELPELPGRVVYPRDGDGSLFYYFTDSGVWRAVVDEKNNAAVACLMDFKNSNVKTNIHGYGDDWVYLLDVLSEDCLLFTEGGRLTLYTASGDIDLSTLKVVEIALGTEFQSAAMDWNDLIVEYNKSHPDCRVVLRDYTIYNNSENPDGGVQRLTMDMLTGIYRPDLVIAEYGDAVTEVIVRDRLYEDLSPFVEQDAVVNRDNLFDCVERMFGTDDGGLWGLTGGVTLWGPLSSRSVLDRYAPDLTEETGWRFEDMLDVAESLPDDAEFYYSLRQDNAVDLLLGPDGYGVFVDLEKHEAHFDSPLFRRWLDFYASLPKDYNDWLQRSPTGQLMNRKDYAGVYDWAYQDRIVLRWGGIIYHELSMIESLFGTKDWVYLGHPAEGHSGIDCRAEAAVVMTRWCTERETAWDVLRTLIAESNSPFRLPALETVYDRILAENSPYNHQYIVYFDGNTVGSERDPDLTPEKLKRPGYIVLPEPEDYEHLKRILNAAGYPLTESLSPEIAAIVAEEISAYLGGVGTPESCAAKIQSRVSIWLSEHE